METTREAHRNEIDYILTCHDMIFIYYLSEGIEFALIEWLLLSRSDLILHTHGSSFAMEAAAVHQRPVAGVWAGILVYHSDVRLPYCSSMQHVKSSVSYALVYFLIN